MALVGLMGAGKSTVGRALADRLDRVHVDADDEVVRRRGCSIAELFRAEGEAAFRAEEAATIAELISGRRPIVLSVGGGAVGDPATRARLAASGPVVWLRASVPTLLARVGDGSGRPMLAGDPAVAMAALAERRRPLYEEVADLVVDVDGRDPDDIAAGIQVALGLDSHRGATCGA